jgi:surfeit locus 1 family protein
MAEALGTEPLLVVAREVPGDAVLLRPIDAAGVPNDHLEYAVTWFSLAAIWAGMTVALVWRIRRRIG